jgi:hypothetical protein
VIKAEEFLLKKPESAVLYESNATKIYTDKPMRK